MTCQMGGGVSMDMQNEWGLCRDVNWVGEHVITYQIYRRVCMDMSTGWESVCEQGNECIDSFIYSCFWTMGEIFPF